MCSDANDDHSAAAASTDDDTVTALDLRIVKASESVDDLFSDRDVSRSGPIRTREQQGPLLISLSQCAKKCCTRMKMQTPEPECKCTIRPNTPS